MAKKQAAAGAGGGTKEGPRRIDPHAGSGAGAGGSEGGGEASSEGSGENSGTGSGSGTRDGQAASAALGSIEEDLAFLRRWGYDAEQRHAIACALEAVAE